MAASPLISVNKYIHQFFHIQIIKNIFFYIKKYIFFLYIDGHIIKEFSLVWFIVDLNQYLILRSPLKLLSQFTDDGGRISNRPIRIKFNILKHCTHFY